MNERQSERSSLREKMRVSNLFAYTGETCLLRSVSMAVFDRKITAIVGPSGCGKSTLVRTLNRMHELALDSKIEGQVYLDGRNIYGAGFDPVEVRRRVGMLFSKPHVFPHMNVIENVLSGYTLRGGGDAKSALSSNKEELAEVALRSVNLWDELKDKLKKKAVLFSVGVQQRICFARALAIKPEVLLLDEPCAMLDPIASAKIEDALHDLREEYTILLVTHSIQQAARVSDFLAFFDQGELIEFGETDQIFTKPADPRTEDYLTGRFG